jgi:hypothetical protein
MIVRSPQEFLKQLKKKAWPTDSPAFARAVMMVEPANFSVSAESAIDNHYMNLDDGVDARLALRQSHELANLLAEQGIEVVTFPGDPNTPDAIFPNNVFACSSDHLIIGHMLHPGRQVEAEREDVRSYFQSRGYGTIDLSQKDCVAELTGVLNIDHARQIGFCGLTGRVDEAGLTAMDDAFDLNMTFSFELQPEEYHSNVIMMVLASRACVIYPDAFVDKLVPEAIAEAFPGRTLMLSETEKNAFAGNCIALTDSDLFMSQTGIDALRPTSRDALESWGFVIHGSRLDEIEKAGGSLRCMLAEIF